MKRTQWIARLNILIISFILHGTYLKTADYVCSSRLLLENVKVCFCLWSFPVENSHISLWHSGQIKALKGPSDHVIGPWPILSHRQWLDSKLPQSERGIWFQSPVCMLMLCSNSLKKCCSLCPPHHAQHYCLSICQDCFHLFSEEKEQNHLFTPPPNLNHSCNT